MENEKVVTTYVVGTKVQTSLEGASENFFTCDTSDKRFHTLILPRYYRDTRNEAEFQGRFSDIFTSSYDPMYATKYNDWEEAEK